MKNKPITFQVWIVMTCFVIFISLVIVLTVSISINNFFESNVMEDLRNRQSSELENINLNNINIFINEIDKALQIFDYEIVKHCIIESETLDEKIIYNEVAEKILDNLRQQENSYDEYILNYHHYKLFYIVKKIEFNNKDAFFISAYWDKEQNLIMYRLIGNIIKVMSVVVIINIILAEIFSKSITAPIRYIEKKVTEIAEKYWDTEIVLNRGDELGRLASSINTMKNSLKEKDIQEQTFIQTISHDLKTPVMIIRSYTQALKDKLYINNSFEETVDIIEKETIRLESKIEKLLYLYSFDYIMKKRKTYEEINLGHTIRCIVKKLFLCHKDIKVDVHVHDVLISGSLSDLTHAFENILENNLRYAKSYIYIKSKILHYNVNDYVKTKIEIEFFNDGSPIDDTVINNLFSKFQKGKNGKFGLGLFIAKKIIEFHEGKIRAENIKDGVVFRIILPLKS